MIEVRNLTKSFGENLIWSDITFDIEDNETIAIIGKSGSGKSVLLKHLNALLYPDSGDILIDGQCLFELSYSELRKTRQRFGILFQEAPFSILLIHLKMLPFHYDILRIKPKMKFSIMYMKP